MEKWIWAWMICKQTINYAISHIPMQNQLVYDMTGRNEYLMNPEGCKYTTT